MTCRLSRRGMTTGPTRRRSLAVCRDDADSQADVGAILRHGNTFGIAAVLAKPLSETIAEQGVCHEWFRYI
jgi:hypothetical protein